ncbi:MAG: GYD domain-containing protein [Gammaproteobacteria bacterium]|jgi:uncharacterized protein with GYD domain|nr:MAG: GYD domain-containing protein [Gammaproteobacteria bacterium]
MATFIMSVKYTSKSLKGISGKRTDEATELLKEHGGELKAGYALLGDTDLVLVVELPDNASAMKASVALSRLLAVSINTAPAMSIKEFDKLLG